MPRYPRKAYCLDRGDPQTKENSQNKIEQKDIEKLLEESNDVRKIMTLNQLCDTKKENLPCSKCDYKTTEFLEWFYHRRSHSMGTFIEKRFATTIYNTEYIKK